MKSIFSFLLLILFFSACTSDQLPEPSAVECNTIITYTTDIKAIVDNSCAYEGCHVAGFGSGDFTSFDALQGTINSGSFEQRAVVLKSMPPSYAPDGRPMELTEEELVLVKCWIADGYQE